MANKTTVALTREQYEEIIQTMRSGGAGFRANNRIATALGFIHVYMVLILSIYGLYTSFLYIFPAF